MNLKQFKQEFRLICSDEWGDAMDAWFECAGRLSIRGLNIPDNWEYRTGLGSPCDRDSYFYSLFKESTTKDLRIIGNFLFRYCQMLKHQGKDY
jgi:hypothetical protein